jgi:hypothetical protein
MTLNSETAAQRQAAYDKALKKLHDVIPGAVPVARLDEAFAIPRVAEQARQAVPPEPLPPSSEVRLLSRVSAMQGSVSELVARAKRLGIKCELPKLKDPDPLAQLQALNDFHDKLERKIEYFNSTTKEQRAIDELRQQVWRIERRLDAMAVALKSFGDLVALLMPKEKK